MSGRTKVGVVSFAHMHAYEYAAALNELGDVVEFAGVADPDDARGREAARRFGVPFAGVEELLGAADAVIVCSETRRHAGDAILALESGVHVLCEKPISTTVEDARKMLRAAEEAGRQLRMAFPVRYIPAVRQTKEVIESGEIGRVLAVNSTNHGKVPDGWFLDPDAAGGGAVMDHTVHLADALRWMLGAEVESVYAEIGAFFGDSDLDDGAILTLDFANGVFATIDPSWSRGAGFPTWGDVTFRITGTEGVLLVDAFAQHMTAYDHETSETFWLPTGEDMNLLMLRDFVLGIRDDSPAGAGGLDGLRAVEVALAAYRSGSRHEPERVERTEA